MSDLSEVIDYHKDKNEWQYNLCSDIKFATWLKTKTVIES